MSYELKINLVNLKLNICLRYKTIFRRKNFKQNRLNNDMSIVIEDNLNNSDNSNCDTHFVDGKLIISTL